MEIFEGQTTGAGSETENSIFSKEKPYPVEVTFNVAVETFVAIAIILVVAALIRYLAK